MPDDTALMPAARDGAYGNLAPQLGGVGMSPSLRILLDEGLFDRVKQLAGAMARAQGMTPPHLLGKAEACHIVVNIAIDTGLSPYFVARHTYQTPGGQIGYDGALVQAILEQSGRFVGGPQIEYSGDWSKVIGKFEIKTSQKGNEFIKATWTRADAAGLGVIVRWQVRGEPKPRVWPGERDPFMLTQCFPLNSPLWGTDPKSQIAYLAIRRFANIAAPGILGASGVAGEEIVDASERARDVTPAQEPRREQYADETVTDAETEASFEVVDLDGVVHEFATCGAAVEAVRIVLAEAARQGIDRVDGAWESNAGLLLDLAAVDHEGYERLCTSYANLRERVNQRAKQSAAAGSEIPERADADDPEPNPSDGAEERPDDGVAGPSEAEPRETAPAEVQTAGTFSYDKPGPSEDLRIAVPMKRGTTQPDHRTWCVALFQPKLRRQTDPNDLAFLLGDNEAALEACRHGGLGPDELAGLEADIKAAWARCK